MRNFIPILAQLVLAATCLISLAGCQSPVFVEVKGKHHCPCENCTCLVCDCVQAEETK